MRFPLDFHQNCLVAREKFGAFTYYLDLNWGVQPEGLLLSAQLIFVRVWWLGPLQFCCTLRLGPAPSDSISEPSVRSCPNKKLFPFTVGFYL